MLIPPTNLTPRQLFRLLIQPIPQVPIAGFPDLPLPPLVVRALSSQQLEQALTSADPDVALLSAALGLPVEAFGSLTLGEMKELAHQARVALSHFPCFGYSDVESWAKVLRKGTKGTLEGYALGSCVSDGGAEQPERYWGLPLNQLLDCHWFAYRAAKHNLNSTKS